jgi:uncharacterized protein involved in exopolysaccharide biosynthesis
VRNSLDIIPVNDEELTLKDVIQKLSRAFTYLLSKGFLIVIFVALGLLVGWLYANKQKPVYEAILTFALQDDQVQGGAGAYSGLASQLGIDLSSSGGGPFEGSNVLELMESRSVIEKTLLSNVNYTGKTQTLAEVYIQMHDLRKQWKDNPKLENIQFAPNANPEKFTIEQDSVLKFMYQDITKNYLTVQKVENATSIISLSVKSTNQLFAKIFAETLVKDVSDFYIETKTKKTVENIAILKYQTDSVRRELNSAIHGVAASSDINPNANPNMQVLHVGAQRRNFDVQVNQTMLAELVRNLEMAKVTLRKETPLIQVIDKPILPLDVKMFSKIKGILVGGFAGGAVIIVYLLMQRFLKKVMAS